MPTTDNKCFTSTADGEECKEEVCEAAKHPELYRVYAHWQIWESVLSALFCIAFVAGITTLAIVTGQKWMSFFYLLPTLCYVASLEVK